MSLCSLAIKLDNMSKHTKMVSYKTTIYLVDVCLALTDIGVLKT